MYEATQNPVSATPDAQNAITSGSSSRSLDNTLSTSELALSLHPQNGSPEYTRFPACETPRSDHGTSQTSPSVSSAERPPRSYRPIQNYRDHSDDFLPLRRRQHTSFQEGWKALQKRLVSAWDGFSKCKTTDSAESPSLRVEEKGCRLSTASTSGSMEFTTDIGAPLGFTFSPAGLLLPYHLGVISCLQHFGVLNDETPIAGASAGALAVVTVGCNVPMSRVMETVYRVEDNIRRYGAAHRLHDVLYKELDNMLPSNAHELLNERLGLVTISYTHVWPFLNGQFVSRFENVEDIKECLAASCNIPFYFSRWPTVTCRGQPCVDGYFASTRTFGCPKTSAPRDIYVIPFSAKTIRISVAPYDCISPDLQAFDKFLTRSTEGRFPNDLLTYLSDFPAPEPPPSSLPVPSPTVPEAPVLEAPVSQMPLTSRRLTPPRTNLNLNSGRATSPLSTSTPITPQPVSSEDNTVSATLVTDGLRTFLPSATLNETVQATVENPSTTSENQNALLEGLEHQLHLTDDPPPQDSVTEKEIPPSSQSDKALRRLAKMWGIKDFNAPLQNLVAAPLPGSGAFLQPIQSDQHSREAPATNIPSATSTSLVSPIPVLEYTVHALLKMALDAAANDEILVNLYNLGRADAYRWLSLEALYATGRIRLARGAKPRY